MNLNKYYGELKKGQRVRLHLGTIDKFTGEEIVDGVVVEAGENTAFVIRADNKKGMGPEGLWKVTRTDMYFWGGNNRFGYLEVI